MRTKFYTGIDASINGTAIVTLAVYNKEIVDIDYKAFSTVKKHQSDHVVFDKKEHHIHDTERFYHISKEIASFIAPSDIVAIEGYALGAKGKVFNIAEFTGNIKRDIWDKRIPLKIYTPGQIKKHASGKGNSNKLAMYETYLALPESQMKIDISTLPEVLYSKGAAPTSDIIDAFFIAHLLYTEDINGKLEDILEGRTDD